jgi:hypothetical protein
MELQLCGMIKGFSDAEGQWVRLRNRIFASVFNVQWLQSRGDRRYLGGAIWKWRESGKKKDYLLRGQALMEALARDERLWTDEEREFLVEGLKEQIQFMQSQLDIVRAGLKLRKTSLNNLLDEVGYIMKSVEFVDRSSRTIANYLIFVGVLLLISALYRLVSYREYGHLFNLLVGFLSLVVGAALRWIHRHLRPTLTRFKRLQDDDPEVTSSLRTAEQAWDDNEAIITTLREHLARLTASNPKR